MVRLALIGAVAVGVFWIFSIVDCGLADGTRVRALPKWAWVLIVVLVPLIGGLLWFFFGRGRKSAEPVRSSGPDDDPEFLRRLAKESEQRERIRRLEQQLADLDKPADGGTPGGAASNPRPKKNGDDPSRPDA